MMKTPKTCMPNNDIKRNEEMESEEEKRMQQKMCSKK